VKFSTFLHHESGTPLAIPVGMGIKRLDELIAWRLAVEFKIEVYRIVKANPGASRDFRYRDQLFDAASGAEMTIAEGFVRFRAPQIIQFFTYARASLEESKRWLADGIHRGHFEPGTIHAARGLAIRCDIATLRFIQSLLPFVPAERRARLCSRRISARQLHRMLRALRARRARIQHQRTP
jgi:four helix bundle protein